MMTAFKTEVLYPELEYVTKLYTITFSFIHYLLSYYFHRFQSDRSSDFPSIDVESLRLYSHWLHVGREPAFPAKEKWANEAMNRFKKLIVPNGYFNYKYEGERRAALIESVVHILLQVQA